MNERTELTDPRAVRTRRMLIAAAARLLADRDADAVSVTEVVSRAGVSRPPFYQHFGDIPTLVAAAGIDGITAIFAESDAELAGVDGAEFVRRTIANVVDALYARRVFYKRVMRGVASHDVVVEVTEFVRARMRGRLVVAGDGGAPDTDDRLLAIAAGATWLLVRWLDSDFTGDDAPERMTERLVAVLLSLLGTAPTGRA